MKVEETLHIIVIDDSSNDAEALSNTLRNAGLAVRAAQVRDEAELRETLATHQWDMVLAKAELPLFSALDALKAIPPGEIDLPFIVVHEGADARLLAECLKAGGRDAVSLKEPGRLEHAVLRELRELRRRRQQKECEHLLRETSKRAQSLVESSRDAIAYVHEGMHIYANDSYLQMFGYSSFLDVEGMPLMNMVSPEDHGKFREFLRDFGRKKSEHGSLEVRGLRVDGSVFSITMEFSPAHYEGEGCTQIVIHVQQLNKELERRLDDLSKQDLLTGLYNRQYFLEVLQQTLAAGSGHGVVLYVEPDRFQGLREEIGIAASDMIVADFAALLRMQLGVDGALLARFDGQAFTALIPDIDGPDAEQLARKLIRALEELVIEAGGRTVTLTCSVGAAVYNESLSNAHDLVTRAEKARRKVFDAGGNGVQLYNPAAEEMAAKERTLLWTRKLKTALLENSFYLVFQPIVSLHGDHKENYQVYLRMTEEGHDVNPVEFITAAEQSGLMIAVDRWVLHNTVRLLCERQKGGKDGNFFVSLSEASVRDPNLLPWLRELLKAAKLDRSSLTIDVAEPVALANLNSLKLLFEALGHLHVRTAFDHFGMTPNSASLLRHIRPAFLKLDVVLMKDFARSPENQRRVKELSAAAGKAGIRTVAQFVEDANTLAALWSCGIDYIQGYFLARPGRELNYDFDEGA